MQTERLARFVVEAGEIPAPVLESAQIPLIDTLGVGLAGTREPVVDIALRCVQELETGSKATVWGRHLFTSAADAAFINGIASHALDFDDTMAGLRGHPSATMVPVALAVGEIMAASGHEVLTAYALGLEVAGKLGRALGDSHYLHGWHSTATVGIFSSTAVAARLWRMSARELCHARGVAASQAAGLVRNLGTMTKPLQVGHAARCAVHAATLARSGFTADPAILDGKHSFIDMYHADGPSLSSTLNNLGNPWEAVVPGISYKRWPCCYCTHRAVGGLLELLRAHSIASEEIEKIRVGFPPGTDEPLIYTNPQTGLEGKFSIEYVVAAIVLDRRLGLETFTDAMARRPALREMMRRVERYRVADANVYSGVVGYNDIEISTGRGVFSTRVTKTPGSPAWPMLPAEHEEKFLDCARRALTDAGARWLLELARSIQRLDDIAELTRATAGAQREHSTGLTERHAWDSDSRSTMESTEHLRGNS